MRDRPTINVPYEWWRIYGPFEVGLQGMPHIGHMIRWYREQKGWKVDDLAQALGISKTRTYELEEDIRMPKDLSRREILAKLLSIPPILLNIPSLEIVPLNGVFRVLDRESMERYENILSLCWHAYYTSGAHLALALVMQCIHELERSLLMTSGVAFDQLLALKCRFLQLQAVITRDQLEVPLSLRVNDEAIGIARHLGNPDLLAAALFRRARTFLQEQDYAAAARDIDEALRTVKHGRDAALRAYVAICWAEIHSSFNLTDKAMQQKCLTLMDGVAHSVRSSSKNVLTGEGSFTRVDLPGLFMERANTLMRFGNKADAEDALAIVQETLERNFIRWQGNLGIANAHLCLVSNDIDGACLVASDTLRIVRATHSRRNEQKIKALFLAAYHQYPRLASLRTLGRELGYAFSNSGELVV